MNALVRQSVLLRGSRLLLSAAACAALVALVSGCASLPSLTADRGGTGPATVTGQVTSERGAIITGAAVRLSGPDFSRHAQTDVTGRYTFERVPLGTYTLHGSAAGYKSGNEKVTVDKEASVQANLKLKM